MRESYRALKVFSVVVVVAMVSSLFLGCLAGGQEPTIESIKERGTLIVGTSTGFPPFESINRTTGDPEGFDIDIAQKIADELDVELVVQDLDFSVLVGSVKTGLIDMAIAGMTILETRNMSVTFSNSYFRADQAILVTSGRTDINTVDNLTGKKIAVNAATTGYYWVFDNLVSTGKVAESDVHSFGFASDAILELTSGRVDAVVIDKPVADAYVARSTGLKVVYTILTNEYYGIAMKKGATDLIDYVNNVLKDMVDSGEMEDLVAKWF
ncbi:MAG: transporter substrate-binding domain-containing protein [Methanomassiliicoccales archaeon]|nr:transporter substrate-binding domain-containing protein [Methanomassiliicoccales archaeon]